jgi:hypothetical protein
LTAGNGLVVAHAVTAINDTPGWWLLSFLGLAPIFRFTCSTAALQFADMAAGIGPYSDVSKLYGPSDGAQTDSLTGGGQ